MSHIKIQQTNCAYCHLPLPKTFFGRINYSRPVIDVYACSARCEAALCDLLDGVSLADVSDFWTKLKTMPREDYLRECKQRQVKP